MKHIILVLLMLSAAFALNMNINLNLDATDGTNTGTMASGLAYEEICTVSNVKLSDDPVAGYTAGFTSVKPNKIIYEIDFTKGSASGLPFGSFPTQQFELFGDGYYTTSISTTQMKLTPVDGRTAYMSLGTSMPWNYNGKTYTVTINSLTWTCTGSPLSCTPLSINVFDGTSSQNTTFSGTLPQTKTVLGLGITVVGKSFVPGYSTEMRFSSDSITLNDGLTFPLDSDWKVNMKVGVQPNPTHVTSLEIVYDKTLQSKDQVTDISTPHSNNRYLDFYYHANNRATELKCGPGIYDGVIAPTEYTTSTGPLCHKTSLSATDCIHELTYDDPVYNHAFYDVPLQDDGRITAYLAQPGGYIGHASSVSPPWPNFTTWPATSLDDFVFNKYTPLVEDDIFFVNDMPIKINYLTASISKAGAQVQFIVGYGSDSSSHKTVKANDGGCVGITNAFGTTNAKSLVECTIPMVGSSSVKFAFIWDKNVYDGEKFILVTGGADNDIDTYDKKTITWVNAWDELHYKDAVYEKAYAVPLHDGSQQTAFLAADANGLVGDPSSTAIFGAGTTASTWKFGKYFPLYEDDVFFVWNTPVRIKEIKQNSVQANAQIEFIVNYGSSSAFSKYVKANDGACTNTAGVVTCKNVNMMGSHLLDFKFVWNPTTYTGTPFIVIDAGADNDIDTMNEQITWDEGTGIIRDNLQTQYRDIRDIYGGVGPCEASVHTKDTAAPKITNFKVVASGKTVTATWNTDERATSAVKCSLGQFGALGSDITANDNIYLMAHSLAMSNVHDGDYSCAATSADELGNKGSSSSVMVKVGSGSPGIARPPVGIEPGEIQPAKPTPITKPIVPSRGVGIKSFRFGFKSDDPLAQYNDYIVWGIFGIVLIFCILGALKDAKSATRLFKWD